MVAGASRLAVWFHRDSKGAPLGGWDERLTAPSQASAQAPTGLYKRRLLELGRCGRVGVG